MLEVTAVDLPEPRPPCECRRTMIDVVSMNETTGDSPTFHITGRIVCRDCGEVLTLLTPQGFDDTFRLTFAKGLKEKLAAAKASKAQAKAAKPAPTTKAPKNPPDPSKGLPGTEMLSLTAELGIVSPASCGCKSTAAMMDRLGVSECRARSADLRMMIAAGWETWGWKDKLKAVAASAWKAAGLGVNPTDPVRDLVEIALDRADAKLKTETKQ